MDSIIRTIQEKTGSLLKKEAKNWLDSHPAGVEKANVYLVPTLVGLLNKRINSREEAREAIALFEEENMQKEWAESPDSLLDLFRRGDGAIPEKVKNVYQFILQDERPLVTQQLSSTGDINPSHLDRVLAFLCAIIAAQILRSLETESQKGRKLLSILRGEEEYIKIQTPSKLHELIKEEEKPEPSPDALDATDGEQQNKPPKTRIRSIIIFLFLFIGSVSVLYWIKSPQMNNLSPMIQWHPAKQKQMPDQKIWQIAPNTSLTLKQDDPLNSFVSYFLQSKPLDTIKKFRLKAVSSNPEDSLVPAYYMKTIKHLKTLQQAHPSPPFHLSITLTPNENSAVSGPLIDHLRAVIFEQLPFMAQGSPYAFMLQINKPKLPLGNRTTTLPDQTEVQWILSLDPRNFK